jgi:TRAP-type C4-dicarboxylate transport system permease small subunit
METLARLSHRLTMGGWLVSVIAVVAMFVLSVVDMVGRKLFQCPVPGFVDLVSILMLLTSSAALARVQVLGRHTKIEFVLQRMPNRWQRVLGVVASVFVWFLFLVIIWRCVVQAASLQAKNQLWPILPIAVFPFYYALALACLLVLLVLTVEMVDSVRKESKK